MPQPTAPGHTWAVTGQEEEPTLTDEGQPSTVHHVHFQTNTGHRSHVSIPDETFSARTVAQAIAAKAQEMNMVHGLNSTNAPSAPE